MLFEKFFSDGNDVVDREDSRLLGPFQCRIFCIPYDRTHIGGIDIAFAHDCRKFARQQEFAQTLAAGVADRIPGSLYSATWASSMVTHVMRLRSTPYSDLRMPRIQTPVVCV